MVTLQPLSPASCLPSLRSLDSWCRHFILLFWNQTLTWASVRPRLAASCLLSGLVIYFCIWNLTKIDSYSLFTTMIVRHLFSSPLRCRFEKTALVQLFFRLLPPKPRPGIPPNNPSPGYPRTETLPLSVKLIDCEAVPTLIPRRHDSCRR